MHLHPHIQHQYLALISPFHQVPFVFNDPSELVRPGEREVAASMACYWTNFAWNSDPNNATGRASLYSQKCAQLPSWEVGGCTCVCAYVLVYVCLCIVWC